MDLELRQSSCVTKVARTCGNFTTILWHHLTMCYLQADITRIKNTTRQSSIFEGEWHETDVMGYNFRNSESTSEFVCCIFVCRQPWRNYHTQSQIGQLKYAQKERRDFLYQNADINSGSNLYEDYISRRLLSVSCYLGNLLLKWFYLIEFVI